MAAPGNAFTTYDAKGNREDLSNNIYNIDPFDTPIMSAAKRRGVKNRTFDWQSENLPTVNVNNAQLEGFLLTQTASQPTVRLNNVTQISSRDATVSGTQEKSDAAGKGSEMAHQLALKSKVLKSDMESIMCSRQARNDGDVTSTARRTESIPHFIARGTDRFSVQGSAVIGVKNGTGTAALPTASTTTWTQPNDGTIDTHAFIPLTEVMLGDAMQAAYNNGAHPSLLVVPPGIKRTVSTFVGRSTSQVLVGKMEITQVVDIIATDFGRIRALPSLWFPGDTNGANLALLVDPQYVAVAFFRSFRQFLMAKVGDAETRMILTEWGIEMRNPMAHIVFNGITTNGFVGS